MAHLWLAIRRLHPQKPRIPRRGLSGEIRPRSESLAGHFECPRRLQPAFPTTSSGLASGTLRHTSVQRLATRKPMLLFSFVASLLLRFEDRRLFSLLFHGPPRSPRLVLASVPQVKAHPPDDAPSAAANSAHGSHAPPSTLCALPARRASSAHAEPPTFGRECAA